MKYMQDIDPARKMRELDNKAKAYVVNHISTVDGKHNWTDEPGFDVLGYSFSWLLLKIEKHTIYISWNNIAAIEIVELP